MSSRCAAPHAFKIQLCLALSAAVFLAAETAKGESDPVKEILPTAWIQASYGLSTYKSELVESNDTGALINYAIGANVGEEKTFGLVIRTDSSAIDFKLNESKIESSWRDTVIRYRWGYAYIGGILGYSSFAATSAGAELFSGTGTGYGVNFGGYLPLGRDNALVLDGSSVTIGEFNEVDQKAVKFGARTDVSIYGQMEIMNDAVHSTVGYTQRTHAVSLDGSGSAETHTATWVGFLFGANF